MDLAAGVEVLSRDKDAIAGIIFELLVFRLPNRFCLGLRQPIGFANLLVFLLMAFLI